MIDLRKLLAIPVVYSAFTWFVGGRGVFVRDYVRPKAGDRVLDIGCGPGTMLGLMPEGVDYLGADLSAEYIDSARKAYGSRGKFICQRVDREAFRGQEGFDIVIACGLLHHLNDNEADDLFDIAQSALKPGGRFVTLDGCYTDDQSRLARYIVSRDRGEFVRPAAAYQTLARKRFSNVKAVVSHDMMRIPYSLNAMECVKS
jgi:cyclopropane fatty-acyl-phospholipid synthase-like methyltransferase